VKLLDLTKSLLAKMIFKIKSIKENPKFAIVLVTKSNSQILTNPRNMNIFNLAKAWKTKNQISK